VKLLRQRAPVAPSSRSALADYAPTICAIAGVAFGQVVAAPDRIATVVTVLGIVMAVVGALLLGVAWPREWIGRSSVATAVRALALHFTVVPSLLCLATLAGLDLPPSVWIFALGPIPISLVSFARLYGYSTRAASTGLVLSLIVAAALLPVAIGVG
jgi:hypothetical protein